MFLSILSLLAGILLGFLFSPCYLSRWLKKQDQVLIINYVNRDVYRVPREEAVKHFPEFAEGLKKYPMLCVTDAPE